MEKRQAMEVFKDEMKLKAFSNIEDKYKGLIIKDVLIYNFRKGKLQDCKRVDGKWYGTFESENGFMRRILIDPTEKEKDEYRDAKTHAFCTLESSTVKSRGMDNSTGFEISPEEAQIIKDTKGSIDVSCPRCKSKFTLVRDTIMKTGKEKVAYYRMRKSGGWCCQNSLVVSVLLLDPLTTNERITDDSPRTLQGVTVKIKDEIFIYKNGKITTEKFERTNKIAFSREALVKNIPEISELMKIREVYLIKNTMHELKKAKDMDVSKVEELEPVENYDKLEQLIKEHVINTVAQVLYLYEFKDEKNFKVKKQILDSNVDVIYSTKDYPVVQKLFRESNNSEKNLAIIDDYYRKREVLGIEETK
ncbi:MAG: hypothetical protein ACRC5T_02550 [Cetobacterium sp.]